MSEYQTVKIKTIRLSAFLSVINAIKDNIEIREIDYGKYNQQYLTSYDRAKLFGESLSKRINDMSRSINNIPCNNDSQLQTAIVNLSRALALYDTLNDEKYLIMGAITERILSVEDRKMLNTAKKLLESKNISGVSAMQDVSAGLLKRLSDAARYSHLQVINAEKRVIIEKTLVSLEAMGYQTKSKTIGCEIIARGKKKDISIVAQLDENNDLHIDMAGFQGSACKAELVKLNEELKKHGIDIEIHNSVHHGKKDGGGLAKDISRELPIEFEPVINHNRKATSKFDPVRHIRKMSAMLVRVNR